MWRSMWICFLCSVFRIFFGFTASLDCLALAAAPILRKSQSSLPPLLQLARVPALCQAMLFASASVSAPASAGIAFAAGPAFDAPAFACHPPACAGAGAGTGAAAFAVQGGVQGASLSSSDVAGVR